MGSSIDVSSTGALVNQLMNPPNPMEQLGKTIQGINALKSFQANQASADAYRQSVDPTTGEVDLGKYKALMSQGPGAWSFGPQTQQAGQAVGAVGEGTTRDVQSKMAQINAAGQMMYPLLRDGYATQSIDPARVQAQLDQAHATGLINDQQYQAWSGQLKGLDAHQAYGFVLGANEANEGARAFLPPQMYNYGPGGININPASGGLVPPGGVITHGLTPGEAIGTTEIIVGNQKVPAPNWVVAQGPAEIEKWARANIPGYVPYTYQPPTGGPAPAPSGPTTPTPAPAPAPGTITPPGRYPRPAAPTPPTSPPAATGPDWVQPPPPNPDLGPAGVSPKPGYEKTAAASRDAHNALQAEITQSQQIKPTLSDMESNIRQGATTGVGAQQLSGLRQALINFGITPDRSAGDNPNQASAQAAQEEFNKNAALLQGYQLGALGRPTDARQELSEASRPGGAISTQGNLNLIHMLEGNQQAIEVVGDAWAQAQKAGWTSDRFNEWANQHFYTAADANTRGGKFNRRVFWMANAPDLAAQQEIFKNLPEGQKTQFRKDLQYAKNQGWIVQKDDGSIAPASP